MSDRYAVIDGNGNVVNAVNWDGSSHWKVPTGHQAIKHDEAETGWRYVNGEFIAPEDPIISPVPIDPRQEAIRNDPDYQDMLTKLQSMTPAQIKNYVQNNVSTLGDAKQVLARILLMLSRSV